MDCAECTEHVRKAIADLPGVQSVEVFLASEKASVRLDEGKTDLPAIRLAVKGAGYSVPDDIPAARAAGAVRARWHGGVVPVRLRPDGAIF